MTRRHLLAPQPHNPQHDRRGEPHLVLTSRVRRQPVGTRRHRQPLCRPRTPTNPLLDRRKTIRRGAPVGARRRRRPRHHAGLGTRGLQRLVRAFRAGDRSRPLRGQGQALDNKRELRTVSLIDRQLLGHPRVRDPIDHINPRPHARIGHRVGLLALLDLRSDRSRRRRSVRRYPSLASLRDKLDPAPTPAGDRTEPHRPTVGRVAHPPRPLRIRHQGAVDPLPRLRSSRLEMDRRQMQLRGLRTILVQPHLPLRRPPLHQLPQRLRQLIPRTLLRIRVHRRAHTRRRSRRNQRHLLRQRQLRHPTLRRRPTRLRHHRIQRQQPRQRHNRRNQRHCPPPAQTTHPHRSHRHRRRKLRVRPHRVVDRGVVRLAQSS